MSDPVIKRIFILLATGAALYVLWLLMPVLPPFFAAFVLAYVFAPLIARLTLRYRWPRWLAITLVFLLILVAVILLFWIFTPILWTQLLYAKEHIPDAVQWLNGTLRPWLKENLRIKTDRIGVDQMINWSMSYLQQNYNTDTTRAVIENVVRSSMNVINVASVVVLVPVVAFYMLLNWPELIGRLSSLIPRKHIDQVHNIIRECDEVLTAFVKGQLLVMFILGIVYAVGLQLVGIQVGIIIGLIAGLASIIPYLGFVVGLIAAMAACLFQYGVDWPHIGLVAMVFIIGQILEGYVLQPYLLGDKIGLSPVAVIFSILAGAQLMGFFGMLLALPVAAIIVVLLRHAVIAYHNSAFYLGRTSPAPMQCPILSASGTPEQNLHLPGTELAGERVLQE